MCEWEQVLLQNAIESGSAGGGSPAIPRDSSFQGIPSKALEGASEIWWLVHIFHKPGKGVIILAGVC